MDQWVNLSWLNLTGVYPRPGTHSECLSSLAHCLYHKLQ